MVLLCAKNVVAVCKFRTCANIWNSFMLRTDSIFSWLLFKNEMPHPQLLKTEMCYGCCGAGNNFSMDDAGDKAENRPEWHTRQTM